MKKRTLLLACCTCLFGCPTPPEAQCLVGSDGGLVADAGPVMAELQFRFVNLGREAVTLYVDGQDGGAQVQPMSTLLRVGHVQLIKQRGSIQARTIADGGYTPVTFGFEFDGGGAETPVTFVLRETDNTLPSRLSMNLTIGKQVAHATFEDTVRSSFDGVNIGGIDIEGDCTSDLSATPGLAASISVRNDTDQSCDSTADQYFSRPNEVLPEATPYFVHGVNDQLQLAWVGPIGTDVLVSNPTRKLYVLNAYQGQRPASFDINGILLAQDVAPAAMVRVKSNLIAKATRVVESPSMARFIVDGATLFFPIGATQAGLCKAPYLCDFSNNEDTLLVVSENLASSAAVLKADPVVIDRTARQPLVFATTSSADSKGCVAVMPNDDLCVMGAATTTSGSSPGPASAAGYLKTNRWLYPPKLVNGTMTMTLEEAGTAPRRYIFDNPFGTAVDHVVGGFAIAAAATVVDTNATNRKALFFVDTTVNPWALKTTLSR